MIIMLIQKILCLILGHKFGDYEPTREQRMPDRFYCTRCKKINPTHERWV